MLFLLQPAQMEPPDIDRLIDAYAKPLLRLCYLYLRDYHHAEEAVQDTLYRAYVKYGSFNGQCSEATWITRIAINACKRKQLTNTRAAGSDDALRLIPPKQMSLEQCLEFLDDDEVLEVTPETLRIRKRILNLEQRMKSIHRK